MPVHGKSSAWWSSPGFTYPEMAFLLLVVAIFLAGTVWVCSGAVTKLRPSGRVGKADREGERTMDRLEDLLGSARKFFHPEGATGSTAGKFISNDLDFLADLDGDPATGRFVLDGARGFERVLIYCRGSILFAKVYSSPGGAPREVVLTRGLAVGGTPFRAVLLAAAGAPGGSRGGLRVKEARIRLATTLDGGRTALSRTVVTGSLPPLERTPREASEPPRRR